MNLKIEHKNKYDEYNEYDEYDKYDENKNNDWQRRCRLDVGVILSISKQSILTAFLVAAPILGVALVVGVIISIFQAATSISDSVLGFAPKVIVAGLALMFLGPWMMNKLVGLMIYLISNIPNLVR